MGQHNVASLHVILICFGLVFFFLGAFPREPWPFRVNLVSAGLFCWLLATFFLTP